jgi:hypothetical protein
VLSITVSQPVCSLRWKLDGDIYRGVPQNQPQVFSLLLPPFPNFSSSSSNFSAVVKCKKWGLMYVQSTDISNKITPFISFISLTLPCLFPISQGDTRRDTNSFYLEEKNLKFFRQRENRGQHRHSNAPRMQRAVTAGEKSGTTGSADTPP